MPLSGLTILERVQLANLLERGARAILELPPEAELERRVVAELLRDQAHHFRHGGG